MRLADFAPWSSHSGPDQLAEVLATVGGLPATASASYFINSRPRIAKTRRGRTVHGGKPEAPRRLDELTTGRRIHAWSQ
jgi:hypothetical protein